MSWLVTLTTFYGWWTLVVPSTVQVDVTFQPSYDAGYSRFGTTSEHKMVQLIERPEGIVLRMLDSQACFTFPRTARRRHPRRLRGTYQAQCDGIGTPMLARRRSQRH